MIVTRIISNLIKPKSSRISQENCRNLPPILNQIRDLFVTFACDSSLTWNHEFPSVSPKG